MLLQRAYVGTGNQGFLCEHCGAEVPPATNGGYRNHCPECLWSKHLDEVPGDRQADCGGLMEPVGLDYHSRKGYQVVHRCTVCGVMRRNRLVQEGEAPDNADMLIYLSTQILR